MKTKKHTKRQPNYVFKVVAGTYESLYARGELCHNYSVGSVHEAPVESPMFVYPPAHMAGIFDAHELSWSRRLMLCKVSGRVRKIKARIDIDTLKYNVLTLKELASEFKLPCDYHGATKLTVVGEVDTTRSEGGNIVLNSGEEVKVTFGH